MLVGSTAIFLIFLSINSTGAQKSEFNEKPLLTFPFVPAILLSKISPIRLFHREQDLKSLILLYSEFEINFIIRVIIIHKDARIKFLGQVVNMWFPV